MSETIPPSEITVKSHKVNSTKQLALLGKKWTTLFDRADSEFFLSWRWIASFAHNALDNGYSLYLIKATHCDETVGLGLFVKTRNTRNALFRYTQLYLHKTGNEALDKSWIEYNDFVLDARAPKAIRTAMWSFVISHFSEVDEFILGVSEKSVCDETSSIFKRFLVRDYLHSIGYKLPISADGDTKYKSAQARSQIRRSNKLIEQMGLTFAVSSDTKDYSSTLTKLQPMHKNTWQKESGFCTGTFVKHMELLAQYNDSTQLISAELSDAKHVVAVLIGFVHKETFYYYLSANETSTNNKIKYGLSLHHFVIQWCSHQGLKYYDFLAGDYRYKRSFTDNTLQFSYLFFQRPSLKTRLEHCLRGIKKGLFSKE